MLIFHAIITLLVLGFFIRKFRQKTAQEAQLKKFFWPALLIKVVFGILLGIFYANDDDTFEFQRAAGWMTEYGIQDIPGYLRLIFMNDYSEFDAVKKIFFKPYTNSFFVSKLLSLLNFITGSNYYLNSLFFSVFSFAGCWYFVRTLSQIFRSSVLAAVPAFLFFPSVVFWSSGIMKESLLLGALGVFWAITLQLAYGTEKRNYRKLILLVLSGWLLWKVKFFLAALVIGLTFSWLVLRRLHSGFLVFRQYKLLLGIIPVISAVAALYIIQVSGVFDLPYFFNHLVWDYEALLELSQNKPHIEFSDFQPTALGALKNIPEAILSSFFRPFLFEGDTVFYLAAGLENTFILILFLGAVFSIIKNEIAAPNQFYTLLIIYILIIAAIISLPTPNLGTLNRYRVVYLPFTIYLLLQTSFWQKIIARISRKLLRK